MSVTLLHGDCRNAMAAMEPESVDAIVTDPPYELGFMGKQWDAAGVSFDPETWRAAHRVLKPGGHLLAFGGTRTFHRIGVAIEDGGFEIKDCLSWLHGQGFPKHKTHLKPGWEPIVLAAKRGERWLNVDGCRIHFAGEDDRHTAERKNRHTAFANPNSNRDSYSGGMPPRRDYDGSKGRWPANVALDEPVADLLGEPSRFFFVAKASRNERNAGLAGMPDVAWRGNYGDGIQDNRPHTREGYEYHAAVKNHHPTVKPIALMRWLVRLVTPPGGIVLDPFMGSGTTGVACVGEGVSFIGIEQEEDYMAIAERRIAHARGALPAAATA